MISRIYKRGGLWCLKVEAPPEGVWQWLNENNIDSHCDMLYPDISRVLNNGVEYQTESGCSSNATPSSP